MAGSALLISSVPALAQNNCTGPAGLRVSVTGYDFTYISRSLAQGAGGRLVNCVRNNHASRGVFIDWKGSGLTTIVPARGGLVFTERALGRTPRGEQRAFFYGALPTRIDAQTMVERAPEPNAPLGQPLFRLAAQENWSRESFDAPVTVPGEMPVGRNATQVYLPVGGADLNQFIANNPSRPAMIEWLESHPDLLRPFAMTFESRATPGGANLTISYEVRYRLPAFAAAPGPPSLFLRFSDPDLHNRLFGRSDPLPIAGSDGGETVLRASLTIPRARIASRTARLEVRLRNGALVAALPITYAAAG